GEVTSTPLPGRSGSSGPMSGREGSPAATLEIACAARAAIGWGPVAATATGGSGARLLVATGNAGADTGELGVRPAIATITPAGSPSSMPGAPPLPGRYEATRN